MTTPKARWEDTNKTYSGLIWWAKLDDRYQVEVHSETENMDRGILHIFDHKNENKLIHSEPVPVAYGARFNPDILDVEEWKEKAIFVVDNLSKGKKNV